MNTNTIKAYYKAVTTNKRYIIQEDISTNFIGYKYTATNNETLVYKLLESNDYTISIIDCENYYDNLKMLKIAYDELIQAWTQDCYYYEWEEYIKKYELSDNQISKINRLIKD